MKKISLKAILGGSLIIIIGLIIGFFNPFKPQVIVEAYDSLPGIEKIKDQVTDYHPYTILEIIPQENSGEIGYYFADKEPIRVWRQQIAALNAAERNNYLTNLLANLEKQRLLGDGNNFPLSKTADAFSEYLPWQTPPEQAVNINLDNRESSQVKADFIPTASGTGGDFVPMYQVTAAGDGSHDQHFAYLRQVDAAIGGEVFYYDADFIQVDLAALDAVAGQEESSDQALIEAIIDEYNTLIFYQQEDDGSYNYAGTVGVDDFFIYINQIYYVVESLSAPSPTWSESHNFAAMDGQFLTVDNAYNPQLHKGESFNMVNNGYHYVGQGQGSHQIDISGSTDNTVFYDSVYIAAPYQNNRWFERYVFDMDTATEGLILSLQSLTPSQITIDEINNADLIILSAGFDLNSGLSLESGYRDNDLSADQVAAIINKVRGEAAIPLVYDRLLTGATMPDQFKALITALNDGAIPPGTGFVANNIYCFSVGTVHPHLANSNFNTALLNSYYLEDSSPYHDVWQEILTENSLRSLLGLADDDLLPQTVSMATSLRYIINTSDRRIENNKEAIHVLEIQPIRSGINNTIDSEELSKSKVLSWLPAGNGLTEDDIKITTMAITEFIGHIENINEIYDLIYFGASLEGFNQASGKPVYNDSTMNGLYYTNIGDTIQYGRLLVGLLDSDYDTTAGTRRLNIYGEYHDLYPLDPGGYTARISGLDLTYAKVEELAAFAEAGFPIILSNTLVYRGTNAVTGGTSLYINEATVDNSSNLYQVLDDIVDFPNIMSLADIASNQDILLQYLNLSKPTINFAVNGKPTEYISETQLSGNLITNNTLNYSFMIENPTELTPTITSYYAYLYIDINGDGRHNDNELLSDLYIYDDDQNARIDNGQLKAGVNYQISRTVPETHKGAVPWKLEIVKNGNSHVANSQSGITYIKPDEMIVIKVLQIIGTGGKYLTANSLFTGLFSDLRNQGIYDIQIEGKTITDLNNIVVNHTEGKDAGSAALAQLLNSYDMLFLGFQESYGRTDSFDGFNLEVSLVINDYIDSGKAILFSHDNVSTENVPIYNYPVSNGQTVGHSTTWFSGYYINLLLRGKTGLDNYGIVSEDFGFSTYSLLADLNQYGHYVANGYQGIDEDTKQAILDADYSIAYDHGSNRERYLPETQGFSIYNTIAQRTGGKYWPTNGTYTGGHHFSTTRKVSQVNKGQITSYPYNINLSGFKVDADGQLQTNIADTLQIGLTHNQWQQVNMNSDDIVVWYCLTDDTITGEDAFVNHYNDVVNSYYIYSKGNVTYTGAGHAQPTSSSTAAENPTLAEAQLFVNTIIAAYRGGKSAPTVNFEDQNGAELEYFLLPSSSSSGDLDAPPIVDDNPTSPMRAVPFILDNPNLGGFNSMSIKVFYQDEAGTISRPDMPDLKFLQLANEDIIIQTAGGSAASRSYLLGNTPYMLFLPDTILANLSGAELNIYIEVSLNNSEDNLSSLSPVLNLRKFSLIPLG